MTALKKLLNTNGTTLTGSPKSKSRDAMLFEVHKGIHVNFCSILYTPAWCGIIDNNHDALTTDRDKT
jgi:hypothetical protein